MNIGVNLIGGIRYRWGGRVYTQTILRALAKMDHHNRYFLFLSSSQDDIFDIKQENFQRVYCCAWAEKGDFAKLFSEQIILPFILKKRKIDVLFSPCNLAPVLSGVKKIIVVQDLRFFHGVDSFWRNTIKKPLFKLILRRSQKIIVPSRHTYQDLIKFIGISPRKVKVIYDAVNIEDFSREVARSEELLRRHDLERKNYLLFVSAHYPWKNIHTLIEIFRLFKGKYRAAQKLAIVGSFDLRYTPQLKALSRKLKLEKDILFLGAIDFRELVALYQNSSVFVFPSLFEGFGLPLVEAMASSTPIVAFGATTSPEIMDGAGLIVEAGDEEAFAEAISRLVKNEDLRNDLIAKGRERAQDFNPEKIAPQVLQEIEALYDNRKHYQI